MAPNFDNFPAEIRLVIFESACLDDGSTGRALSTVSRTIRERSAEYRYQSVAIAGLDQILAFSKVLERLPSRMRRVKHLYICEEKTSRPRRSEGGLPSIPEARMAINKFVTRFFASFHAKKRLSPEARAYPVDLTTATSLVFGFISETLETLAMCATYTSAVIHGGLSHPLPRLLQLTVLSAPTITPTHPPLNAPLLELLHVSGDAMCLETSCKSPSGRSTPVSVEDVLPCLNTFRISRYTGAPRQTRILNSVARSANKFTCVGSVSIQTDAWMGVPGPMVAQSQANRYERDVAPILAKLNANVKGCALILSPNFRRGHALLDAAEIQREWLSRLDNGKGWWTKVDGPQTSKDAIS